MAISRLTTVITEEQRRRLLRSAPASLLQSANVESVFDGYASLAAK